MSKTRKQPDVFLPKRDLQHTAERMASVARQLGASQVFIALVDGERVAAELLGDPRMVAYILGKTLARHFAGSALDDFVQRFLDGVRAPESGTGTITGKPWSN